ncbi:MAG: hypothetical protein BGO90_06090 [Legionella sp. 40-6]|nr:hypothetical protein [Legionella sp.]OJY27617.1 MAG: hypothetical protein BGO90_06090 [Legionella sp. 40-6]
MLHLKIRVSDEKHTPRAINKIVKELNNVPKNTPFTVEFYPAGDLNRNKAQELLQNLPTHCVGIKLSSLTNSSWSYPAIEHIEAICSAIPPHIKILNARNILPAETSFEHVKRFFTAIPKSITHLNLQENHLGSVSFALSLLFPLLQGISLVDIRDNFKSVTEVYDLVHSLTTLPLTISSLYVDLKQHSQDIHNKFFINLPHHIQLLGLVADDFYCHEELTALSCLVPATVTTLKWLCGSKSPTETLITHTPDTVKVLDLTNCSMYSFRRSLTVPQNITTVILNNNQLYLWPISQLIHFIENLPPQVRTISLIGNKIMEGRTEEENHLWTQFKLQNTRAIILENKQMKGVPSMKRAPLYNMLHALFSQNKPHESVPVLSKRAAL